MRNYEYRMIDTVVPSKKYKIGLYAEGTDCLMKTYDGYLCGRNFDVFQLYPSNDGLGAMDIGYIPGKHKISIYIVKEKRK